MDLRKLLEQVAEFQVATDQPVNFEPTLSLPECFVLRYNLMKEENEEYLEASEAKNKVEVLDSLIDQLYVLFGTINEHGMQGIIETAFERVHLNNMTKVGSDGKVLRNAHGKILKPEGFVGVDLTDLLELNY